MTLLLIVEENNSSNGFNRPFKGNSQGFEPLSPITTLAPSQEL